MENETYNAVEMQVLVDQEISHGADLPPGDLGPLGGDTLR
jgi:hypothetical protein